MMLFYIKTALFQKTNKKDVSSAVAAVRVNFVENTSCLSVLTRECEISHLIASVYK